MDIYLDVTVSIRNSKACIAYSLERKQIVKTSFPKEFEKNDSD